MRRHLACLFGVALMLAGAAVAAEVTLTVLPRPAFPQAPGAVTSSGPTRLVLLSSRSRAPAASVSVSWLTPAWVPKRFEGVERLVTVRQPGVVFGLYGPDGASARYLVAINARTHRLRYAFDFASFARPPKIARGDAELVREQVIWAREADGVLYVETAHQTYAESSGGFNAYIAAIDLRTRKTIWRSPALVANAGTFVLAGDALVTGYGFTKEPDYLYLLDRKTGRVRDRLLVPSGPESIARRGNRVFVHTYDHDVVAELRPS